MATAEALFPSVQIPCAGALEKGCVGSFDQLMRHIKNIPNLTQEEEKELFTKFHEQQDTSAAHSIVLANLRFVAYIARSYSGYGLHLEDLMQEGCIGLMKSVKKFDIKRGVRFASFAVYWIKAEIQQFILRNWKIVRLATTKAQRKLFFNLRKFKKSSDWLTHEEVNYIANELNVKVGDVHTMEMRLHNADKSFDESFGESDEDCLHYASARHLEDNTTNPEKVVEDLRDQTDLITSLKEQISILDERSADIIRSRWLVDEEHRLGLKELAAKYSISKERIRQIEVTALKKIKHNILSSS